MVFPSCRAVVFCGGCTKKGHFSDMDNALNISITAILATSRTQRSTKLSHAPIGNSKIINKMRLIVKRKRNIIQ